MTEQELKDKIVEVLDKNKSKWLEVNEPLSGYGEPYIEIHRDKLANALIAAGLTFDGEYKKLYEDEKVISQSLRGTSWQFKGWYNEQKHRAEVAERAARDLIAYYCGYTIENDIDNSLSVALQQAEKELAEEKKE